MQRSDDAWIVATNGHSQCSTAQMWARRLHLSGTDYLQQRNSPTIACAAAVSIIQHLTLNSDTQTATFARVWPITSLVHAQLKLHQQSPVQVWPNLSGARSQLESCGSAQPSAHAQIKHVMPLNRSCHSTFH